MSNKFSYNKPALSLKEQVDRLKARGLLFNDISKLEWALTHIGYYRLSGYWKSFELNKNDDEHMFISGLELDDILDLYTFDRKLRLHYLDALESIEVSIKAILNNHMAIGYTPFWFLDESLFKEEFSQKSKEIFTENKALNDHRHDFLAHFKNKYSNQYVPSWMAIEVLNFSNISKIYSCLKNTDAKKLSDRLNLSPRILKSWLRSLTYTRNVCAHHARLWNRKFIILPEISKEIKWVGMSRGYLGEQTLLIYFLLKRMAPSSKWHEQLDELIASYQRCVTADMGLPNNWLVKLKGLSQA